MVRIQNIQINRWLGIRHVHIFKETTFYELDPIKVQVITILQQNRLTGFITNTTLKYMYVIVIVAVSSV